MRFLVFILAFSAFVQFATAQDPRAVGIRLVRGIDEEGRSNYLREDSNFSIVVYGPTSEKQVYRIRGVDHEFSIDELSRFLTTFYKSFPTKSKTEELHAPIPVPNILYTRGVWTELTEAGPELVTKLAKDHGVALYYVTITSGYTISNSPAEIPGPGLPYDLQCIAHYQKCLKDAATRIHDGEQGGADQPATAVEPRSEGKEKPKPKLEARPQ